MYLKTLVGLYAGQILFFSPEAARAMLADGRAVRVDEMIDEPICDPSPPYPATEPPAQPRGSDASPATGKPAGGDAPQSEAENGKRPAKRGILHGGTLTNKDGK